MLTLTLLGGGLFAVSVACMITWVLLLTGCCGNEDADLVIVNDSGQAVWSIELDYENESRGVRSARNQALMERGQSYGLELEEGAVTVTLSGRNGRELARTEVGFSGERLYLTLEQDGTISVSEEWNNG